MSCGCAVQFVDERLGQAGVIGSGSGYRLRRGVPGSTAAVDEATAAANPHLAGWYSQFQPSSGVWADIYFFR